MGIMPTILTRNSPNLEYKMLAKYCQNSIRSKEFQDYRRIAYFFYKIYVSLELTCRVIMCESGITVIRFGNFPAADLRIINE